MARHVDVFDPSTYPEELEQFRQFCETDLTLDNGNPLVLEPFQLAFLAPYFGGTLENFVLIPKKNGKTTIIAALVIYHLLVTATANCIIVAQTRDQAGTLYHQIKTYIDNSESLQGAMKFRDSQRIVKMLDGIGQAQVRVADGERIDGALITLGIVEEYHAHRDGSVYYVLREGAKGRNGQMVTISTAGSDETGPLGRTRNLVHELEDTVIDGKYRVAWTPDRSLVWHEYAVEPDQIHDLQAVKDANPASWHTIDSLRQTHDSPTTEEADWGRGNANVWMKGGGAVIQGHEWDAYSDPEYVLRAGETVRLGLDLGGTYDTTAIAPVAWRSDEARIVGKPIVFAPPKDGAVDLGAVEEALLVLAGKKRFNRLGFVNELSKNNDREIVNAWADEIATIPVGGYAVLSVTYDRWGAARELATRLTRSHGMTFAEFAEQDTVKVRADQAFYTAFVQGWVLNDGDPTMREHVTNAVRHETSKGWYFGRAKRGRRVPIDALTAARSAHDTWVAENEAPTKVRRPTAMFSFS